MPPADTRAQSHASPLAPGLYIIGTPIGNLEDVTVRALRVLEHADLIACEDTRQTRKLLDHYGIATPTISYHEHNEVARAQELAAKLQAGLRLALVSDAGMPGVADPGYRLVTAAIEHRVAIIPVPGPVALVAALVASGLPTDQFAFRGFLPGRSSQRREALDEIRSSPATEIFYEAPHRIRESLADVVRELGPERPVVVARELTKVHEEFIRGTAAAVLAQVEARELRGEITLIIGKAVAPASQASADLLRARYQRLISEEGLDQKSALKRAAKESGMSRSEAYRELQRKRS
jgi:16S rRNA (cytidine1402-2'-O)-methyltransferase